MRTLLFLLLGFATPAAAIPVSVAPLSCSSSPPECDSAGALFGDATTPSGSFEFQLPGLPPELGTLVSLDITFEGGAAGTIYSPSQPDGFSLSVTLRLETQLGASMDEFSITLGDAGCSPSHGGGFFCTDGNGILRVRSFSGEALALMLQPLVLRYEWIAGEPAGSELVDTRLRGLNLGLRYDYVPVPEPGSLLLVCTTGAIFLGARRRLA